MAQRQRYFNPWWIVLGSTLALIVCNGPMIGFTFGLFLKPVSQEFGWSRGAMSAASGAATLMMAMAVPFTGLLVDRWGVRRVLLPVIVLSSLSVAAISLTSASLWVFVALYPSRGWSRRVTVRSLMPRRLRHGLMRSGVWRLASPWRV
jgi:MFS family permease